MHLQGRYMIQTIKIVSEENRRLKDDYQKLEKLQNDSKKLISTLYKKMDIVMEIFQYQKELLLNLKFSKK